MQFGSATILVVSVLLGACAAYAAAENRPDPAVHDGQAYGEISRGSYLAIAGDCAACHTDPDGGKPYAGGTPIDTPFGTVLSPNLTPDRETGIGAWSDDEFVAALLEGKGRNGKHLYPAMPYTYYAKMSRADALAIRAFLNTLEPVQHRVVANQLPFPFDIRGSMLAWNALFFTPGRFIPVAGKSAAWNRGAYLVEGPGHCGMCHTAKDLLGGDETKRALQGGVLQDWFAPNLTGDPRVGIGNWSIDDVVTYLKTGQNRIAAATGPMSEVIADSTSRLTDADLQAIATYLKDQTSPPQAMPPVTSADDPTMRAGAAIYVDNCAACHAADGSGVPNLFPPLKDSPITQSTDPTDLVQVVLHGTQNVATKFAPTGASMPALGWKLSDAQVAALLDYVRNSWGNRGTLVSADQVHRLR